MAHPPALPAPVLRQARLQLLEGADPASTGIDQRLARSWQRSLAAGLSPTGRLFSADPLSGPDLQRALPPNGRSLPTMPSSSTSSKAQVCRSITS